jgi:putative tricarboxylic transport membrane protein
MRCTAGRVLTYVVCTLAGIAVPTSRAIAYPDRPLELTVPFAAGGGSDIMARTIATIMQHEKLLSQPIVVVNRPGGNGVLGYLHVGQRAGDPYALSAATPSFLIQPLLGRMKLTYRDYTLVAGLALDEFVLIVRADSPHRSVADLVVAARRAPKAVTVGGSSAPSSDSIIAHLVERATGAQFNYVPFKGGGEVLTNLLGGHIEVASANPGEMLDQLEAKRIRALAVASERRLASLPDVPTLRESGIDVVVTQWRGVVAPKGMPADAQATLALAFKRMTESKTWTQYVRDNNLTPFHLAPEAFGRFLDSEVEKMARILREMGLIQ